MMIISISPPEMAAQEGIPSDNSFANNTSDYKEEIYAYGLRNPWKMSFDQKRGFLWVADVGQDKMEEINLI